MSARLTDLSLADAWHRMRRYRPLLLTVVVTLGALRVAPGGPSLEITDLAAAPGPSTTQPVGATEAPASEGAARPQPAARLAPWPAPSPPPTASPIPSLSPAPHPSAPVPTAPVGGQSKQPAPAIAPVVRYTGWASTEARTPIASLGVPPQGLPVANRLGQLAKASFLRVEGSWHALALDTHPDGTTSIPDVALRACAITTPEWSPGGEQSFDDAPEWGDRCVDGFAEDGRWTFALAEIDHPHGVAIVPAAEAPLDFQISLRDPRPAESGS